MAKECAHWIERKVDIKTVRQANLLHGKMYHVKAGGVDDAILGSSNFTVRGLGLGAVGNNIELNLIVDSTRDRRELKQWFNDVWNDEKLVKDVKEDVLMYLRKLYANQSPLRTHLLSSPIPRMNRGPEQHSLIYGADSSGREDQLFDLVFLVVLAGVRVRISGGGESTLGALMRKVWQNRPATRYKRDLNPANAAANEFNSAFNAKLPELEAKFTELRSWPSRRFTSTRFQNNDCPCSFF